MYYQNVRGLRTKLPEFFSSAASETYDVILLTETWLCSDIDTSDLLDDRYIVFRKDRDSTTSSCKRGGGVLVAVKKCFSATLITANDMGLECLWISIDLKFRKKIAFVYCLLPTFFNSQYLY